MDNKTKSEPVSYQESVSDIKTVDDFIARYFPNAYNQRIEEQIFESYSRHAQPLKASVL